eukprot:7050-Pelagococcus_subviridis.AAC.3
MARPRVAANATPPSIDVRSLATNCAVADAAVAVDEPTPAPRSSAVEHKIPRAYEHTPCAASQTDAARVPLREERASERAEARAEERRRDALRGPGLPAESRGGAVHPAARRVMRVDDARVVRREAVVSIRSSRAPHVLRASRARVRELRGDDVVVVVMMITPRGGRRRRASSRAVRPASSRLALSIEMPQDGVSISSVDAADDVHDRARVMTPAVVRADAPVTRRRGRVLVQGVDEQVVRPARVRVPLAHRGVMTRELQIRH